MMASDSRVQLGAVQSSTPSRTEAYLRIGQRGKGDDGWIHLDSHPSADIVATIPPLPPSVTSRQWTIIEGIHVWEHFYRWQAEELARSIYQCLCPGGQLILECPNLEIACRSFLGAYKDSDNYHMHVFYGSPRTKDPSYGHRWGYTPESLRQQLVEHGRFDPTDVKIETAKFHVPDRDFRIVATKR
jgi:predicted SAM-dependent methyltransferase